MYLANTWEVGHRSRLSEGVVWWWGEKKGSILRFPLKLLWERCLVGMTSHLKEVSIGWDHLMHAIEVGNERLNPYPDERSEK